MIAVVGASGNVGRVVVRRLVELGLCPRALTRSADRSAFGPGAEVVHADLDHPGTANRALAGATAAFIATAGPHAPAHDAALADAVARHGVQDVVKVSSVAALAPPAGPYGAAHAAAEDAYRRSGARCTVLRPAAFMSNALQWSWSITAENTVYQPFGTLRQAVVDPADVAEAAVQALTAPGHEADTYTLTGPQALSAHERTQLLAEALGRPLRFVDAPVETARQAMTATGLPADYVDGLLLAQADADPRRGGLPLPTVTELTGRAPGTFEEWVGAHLGDFA
ncbi:NAD(P)H-binding protein [Streptomyces gamaensis]|uniref:NAD(P)H-binding protein n=1 Tax=Streptomyces gamaensis TaxID=1763542 RepID=A0ABW0Z795_9ACTN